MAGNVWTTYQTKRFEKAFDSIHREKRNQNWKIVLTKHGWLQTTAHTIQMYSVCILWLFKARPIDFSNVVQVADKIRKQARKAINHEKRLRKKRHVSRMWVFTLWLHPHERLNVHVCVACLLWNVDVFAYFCLPICEPFRVFWFQKIWLEQIIDSLHIEATFIRIVQVEATRIQCSDIVLT